MRTGVLLAVVTILVGGCGDQKKAAPPSTGAPAAPTGAWQFHDVAEAAGLGRVLRSGTERQEFIPEVKGLGVGLLDYDGDGRLDVFFTTGSSVERAQKREPGFGCFLYRNETVAGGPLKFVDVTAAAKIPETLWAGGPAVADVDGDGKPDILITGFFGNVMLRNKGDGTFEDATAKAGVGSIGWSTGAAFGDLDQDGDLDLYVARYLKFDLQNPPRNGPAYTCMWKQHVVMCGPRGLPPEPDVVFKNRGDGTFEDATRAWGFDQADPQYGLGVLMGDFNQDGRPDVFVANDSSPNFLFENEGGKFVERALERGVAYSEDGREMAGMGVDALDLNGDGVQDIIVTNFSDQPSSVFMSARGRWFESSRATNLAVASYPMLKWGVGIQDFDDDGFADVFVANGHVYVCADDPGTDTHYRQKNQLFKNEKDGRFREIGGELGPGFATPHVGRGAAFGDLDQDGDVDVVVVNLNEKPSLLENRLPPGNGFLAIELAQPGMNREAIGALVTVSAGGSTQAREVRRNSSFLASNDVRAHFGLGRTARADLVTVRWPDGTIEKFAGVGPGRVTLTRGGGVK